MEHLILEEYMESSRCPTQEEVKLISFLISKSNYSFSNWEKGLRVRKLPEGMGSLSLLYKDIDNSNRRFGYQISDFLFKDIDGVDVVVSLNADTDNKLFELDIWKMDYSELKQYPKL